MPNEDLSVTIRGRPSPAGQSKRHSSVGEGSRDNGGSDHQQDTQPHVTQPFGPAAMRVDVYVGHGYFTRPGTGAAAAGATALRLSRSIQ